jgi:hypothetical protein
MKASLRGCRVAALLARCKVAAGRAVRLVRKFVNGSLLTQGGCVVAPQSARALASVSRVADLSKSKESARRTWWYTAAMSSWKRMGPCGRAVTEP